MKKIAALVLALSLLLMASASATTFLGFGTGGTSGTYYAVGAEIATLWNNNIDDLDVTVQATGGSKANIISVVDGEMEVAFSQNDTALYAYKGTDYFDNTVVDGFYAMASLYPEAVQIVAAADSDIATVSDLKGKNVCVGDVGSGTYQNATQVLAAAGLDIETDIVPTYLSFAEAATALIDGQIDASFTTAGFPNPAILEVTTKKAIRLIELSDDEWAALTADCPYYFKATVPAATYGLDADASIPAISATLIVSKDLDDDLVYNLTRVLFEKTGDINHAMKENIKLDTATNGVMIPFHPGAAKYLAENGIAVPDNDVTAAE